MDQDALATQFEQHRASLVALVRHIASDRLLAVVEAEDLVQEVAAAALKSVETAPLDRYSVEQWLRHLARRRVVDAHRHHFTAQRRSEGKRIDVAAGHGAADDGASDLQHWLVSSITSPSGVVSQDARLAAMRDAVQSLPAQQQLAVQMRFIENRSYEDIAAAIDKSESATRVMLSRCLRSLEKTLQPVRPEDRRTTKRSPS